MKMISCLIVDDEEIARLIIKEYANRLPFLQVLGECKNAIEAMEMLQENSVDLLFLDIQMPDMLGTDFLRTLAQKPKVIFTTAYADYALEGFELDAVDYLLKPFSFERFVQAIHKVNQIVNPKNSPIKKEKKREEETNFILVKADYKVHRVFYEEILYIQSRKEYVIFYTDSTKIMALSSLRKLEEELPKNTFIRVHKSYIVAKNKVKALEGNRIHLQDEIIPIGASYKEKVLKELF
ncbi:LytR/AlgR family response regulator transcription factor [Aureivirga marina]|uniref:LytR/AlgR family response regulator transcription factor n=1 Tax=Aureivirga marina TaxID=1182451 RepID=UPI0018C94376|nr:LytTR family DNA-binding domain-containing protein [Aureivirga marina]